MDKEGSVIMFLANMLAGIANLFAKSASSACLVMWFDEPIADMDIL